MCSCNYTYVGPALLVLPLFVISLVNLFVAGPPLKTVVLDSSGPSYGASLPFLQLNVDGPQAKFNLYPTDEMTHFFVVTCYAPDATGPLFFDAQVTGKKHAGATSKALTTASTRPDKPLEKEAHEKHVLQLLQPFLGFSEYQVAITSRGTDGKNPIPMPAMEYRVTYVPTRFTYTQICVRSFFTFTSVCMLFAYAFGVATAKKFELGQLWMIVLLVLLVALNDPMYIARVMLGGNHALYNISVLGQICFSGGLFLFWLVYADGMNAPSASRGCCFYFPKALLVCIYIGVSATMFLVHGRVPDRISVHDALHEDPQKFGLVVALTASLVAVGLWLSFLVTRAVFRLGWKKVEYIYTEREKSFVGITIVFVILWLCGHLYRAVHGRRGSWMQLQLPFLTLTNSYLALLTHAFWPGAEGKGGVAPAEAKGSAADDEREGGLLAEEDDD